MLGTFPPPVHRSEGLGSQGIHFVRVDADRAEKGETIYTHTVMRLGTGMNSFSLAWPAASTACLHGGTIPTLPSPCRMTTAGSLAISPADRPHQAPSRIQRPCWIGEYCEPHTDNSIRAVAEGLQKPPLKPRCFPCCP